MTFKSGIPYYKFLKKKLGVSVWPCSYNSASVCLGFNFNSVAPGSSCLLVASSETRGNSSGTWSVASCQTRIEFPALCLSPAQSKLLQAFGKYTGGSPSANPLQKAGISPGRKISSKTLESHIGVPGF